MCLHSSEKIAQRFQNPKRCHTITMNRNQREKDASADILNRIDSEISKEMRYILKNQSFSKNTCREKEILHSFSFRVIIGRGFSVLRNFKFKILFSSKRKNICSHHLK
jgi:hypothetical protein